MHCVLLLCQRDTQMGAAAALVELGANRDERLGSGRRRRRKQASWLAGWLASEADESCWRQIECDARHSSITFTRALPFDRLRAPELCAPPQLLANRRPIQGDQCSASATPSHCQSAAGQPAHRATLGANSSKVPENNCQRWPIVLVGPASRPAERRFRHT